MSRRIQVGVKAILVNSRGEVLLLRRSAGRAVAAGAWDTPGGKMRFGETVESALRREVREETGLADFEVTKILNIWSLLKSDVTQLVGITFVCRSGGEDVQLSPEHAEFLWTDVGRFLEANDPDAPLKESLMAFLHGGWGGPPGRAEDQLAQEAENGS